MKLTFLLPILATVCSAAPDTLQDNEEDKIRVFSNMAAELVAATDFSTAIKTVRDAMDETDPNKTTRSLASSSNVNFSREMKEAKETKVGKLTAKGPKGSNGSCKKKLKQCEADAMEPAVLIATPELLYIQTGKTCKIERKKNGSDDVTSYKLVSDVGEDTFRFLDRPGTFEDIQPTVDFVTTFNQIFETSNPNVGVTLVSEDLQTFSGPFVVVFSNPTIAENGEVTYEVDQSPDQNKVRSIESIFEGTTEDSVAFKDCSLFIDGAFSTFFCPLCTKVVRTTFAFVGGRLCASLCELAVKAVEATFGLPSGANKIVTDFCGGICPKIEDIDENLNFDKAVCEFVSLCAPNTTSTS